MAEQVAVSGFGVPPVPSGATEHSREANAAPAARPNASAMEPGWVPQPANTPAAPDAGLTLAQVQEMIAAAAPKPVVPPPAAPHNENGAEFDFKSDIQNDPLLVSMTTILSTTVAGLDMDRAMGKAIELGDLRLIDSAYLRSIAGANFAQVEALAKGIVERVNAQTSEATQAVYTIAGDKNQWQAASAAFDQQAPQHMKVVIAKLLDSGDKASISAAAQSVMDFARNAGLIAKPGQYVAAGANAGSAATALDKNGFQDALRKLNKQDRNYEANRAELFQRRQSGKNLGK